MAQKVCNSTVKLHHLEGLGTVGHQRNPGKGIPHGSLQIREEAAPAGLGFRASDFRELN